MLSQASTSFFEKKRSKKTFGPAGCGNGIATTRSDQKFFGSFFQKRTTSLKPFLDKSR
jgi:hypothetical protein